jgi:hypothetical protein
LEKSPAPDFNAAAPASAFSDHMALYKAIELGDLTTIATTMQAYPEAAGWSFFGAPVCVVAVVHNQLDALRLLEAYGADVNAAERPSGMTPLMHAAAANRKEIASFLMGNGANPALTDKDGWTAQRYAEKRGEIDVLQAVAAKAKAAKPPTP